MAMQVDDRLPIGVLGAPSVGGWTAIRAILDRMAMAVKGPRAQHVISEPMSYDEAMARFEGKWVLLQSARTDADGQPGHVRVLAHSASHDAVWQALADRVKRDGRPDDPYQILEAARCIRTGDEARRALAALSERDNVEDCSGPSATRWR